MMTTEAKEARVNTHRAIMLILEQHKRREPISLGAPFAVLAAIWLPVILLLLQGG